MLLHASRALPIVAAARLAFLLLLLGIPFRTAIARPFSVPDTSSTAQPDTLNETSKWKLQRWADLKIDSRERGERFDTAYIARLPERWMFKLSTSTSLASISGKTLTDSTEMSFDASSSNLQSVAFSIGYRGFSAGYSFVVANGKKDNEFVFNYYGNRFGADFLYRYSRSFDGVFKYTDQSAAEHEAQLPEGNVRSERIGADAYYVFRSSRFSYPAAFSHSYIQRQSAGSVIAGVSFSWLSLSSQLTDTVSATAKISSLYIGAGYARNFRGSNWLFHASAMPLFSVIAHDRESVSTREIKKDAWDKFGKVHLVARLAAVRHWHRMFLAGSFVINYYTSGSTSDLRLEDYALRLELLAGIKIP